MSELGNMMARPMSKVSEGGENGIFSIHSSSLYRVRRCIDRIQAHHSLH